MRESKTQNKSNELHSKKITHNVWTYQIIEIALLGADLIQNLRGVRKCYHGPTSVLCNQSSGSWSWHSVERKTHDHIICKLQWRLYLQRGGGQVLWGSRANDLQRLDWPIMDDREAVVIIIISYFLFILWSPLNTLKEKRYLLIAFILFAFVVEKPQPPMQTHTHIHTHTRAR